MIASTYVPTTTGQLLGLGLVVALLGVVFVARRLGRRWTSEATSRPVVEAPSAFRVIGSPPQFWDWDNESDQRQHGGAA